MGSGRGGKMVAVKSEGLGIDVSRLFLLFLLFRQACETSHWRSSAGQSQLVLSLCECWLDRSSSPVDPA